MKTTTKYVGLDVHKDTTVIALADGGRDGEVRLYGEPLPASGAASATAFPQFLVQHDITSVAAEPLNSSPLESRDWRNDPLNQSGSDDSAHPGS